MKLLAGMGQGEITTEAMLAALSAAPSLRPFSDVSVAFAKALSERILLDASFRATPEIMALGHSIRPASIKSVREQFDQRSQAQARRARGLTLHFAPANVEAIAIHTWLLSMLAGNSTVVRVSQSQSPVLTALLTIIGELSSSHLEIGARTAFVTYPHDDAVTGALSQACHTRVIWGGDETIRRVRAIALNPRANEVAFPDRFSLALIRSSALPENADALARKFFNDAFWYDQAACSSPRAVVWVGDVEATKAAQQRFWPAVQRELERRAWRAPENFPIHRLGCALELAARGAAQAVRFEDTRFLRVTADRIDDTLRDTHRGADLFVESRISDLRELPAMLSARDQTISYVGFERPALDALVDHLPARAVDRIVPMGQALDFSSVWDGEDLLHALTREIAVLR